MNVWKCSENYQSLEFQVALEILGPVGSFSCKFMVAEGHVTFGLRKDMLQGRQMNIAFSGVLAIYSGPHFLAFTGLKF